MKCTNPELGAMITRYELGLLTDAERQKFEEHLLSCNACFADFYEFLPVAQTMKSHPQECLEALAAPVGWAASLRQFRLAVWAELDALCEHASVRAAGYAFASAVVAVALLFVFAPEWHYDHLAQSAGYLELSTSWHSYAQRDPGSIQSADSLFQEAIFHYRYQQDTTRADSAVLAMLRQVLALVPTHANAHFFLGVFWYQMNTVDSALVHLKQADALENPEWRQARHWFLGNAHLQRNEVESAQRELRLAAAAGGSYAQAANDLLARIAEIPKQHWWNRYRQESKRR